MQPGESSEPPRARKAVAPLEGLLELSRLTQRQSTLDETVRALATTVAETLGFATAVVNLRRDETEEYEVVAVHGSDSVRASRLGQVTAAGTWEPLLDPRFRRHGVYFVAATTGDPAAGDEAWHPGDALLAPLHGASGRLYGVVSVDEPLSGRRPADRDLELLGALAAHAGLAIESVLQMAALQGALARNRAVLASSLDAVIAVDAEDRVTDFNPAAERTFGYRSRDVLGRDAVELFVPPESRARYRERAAAVRADSESPWLDRRLETTAMRSDGSTFEAELTVTRVEGPEGEEPMFYAFVRDISARRRTEAQLAYLAYHDALTGLPNRAMVEQELDLTLARARRAGAAAALMYIDLDEFKEVNDRLGHAAGDRLLAAVATRLRSVLRAGDVLARHGGDEFLLLLADLADDAAASAERVGSKLLEALREPFVVAGSELRPGASIGVSLFPDDAADTEALLRHADAAMYRAKAAGGGRLAFHRTAGAKLSTQLSAAIANEELELRYEPIRTLVDPLQIIGLEVLVRWRDGDPGPVGTGEIMALADQTSAGGELMEWVLHSALRQAREWRSEGIELPLAINLSPDQLLSPGFAARLRRHLQDAEMSPHDLIIELAESGWMVDAAGALAVVGELRTDGATLAIDHFGAGYLSLARLPGLEFDVVKIDTRLLDGVPEDPAAVALLEAALGLVAACDSEAVADGVRSAAQVDFLARHGVRFGQGPAVAPAERGPDLTATLRRGLVRGGLPRRRPVHRRP